MKGSVKTMRQVDFRVPFGQKCPGQYAAIGPQSARRRLFRSYLKLSRISDKLFHYCYMDHLDDHDLERYHLGMIRDEAELVSLEQHLLACAECAEQAEEAAEYVDAIRQGIILGDFDSDCELQMLNENQSPTSAPTKPTAADLLRQLDRLRIGLRLGTSTTRKLKHHQKVDVDAVLRWLISIRAETGAILERSTRPQPPR